MTAAVAKMTGKGQITVPKAVRDHLSIGNNDRVVFLLDGDRVYVEKLAGKPSASQLFGILHRAGASTVDLEAARATIRAQRASRYRSEREET